MLTSMLEDLHESTTYTESTNSFASFVATDLNIQGSTK